jgi:hypothetical protein
MKKLTGGIVEAAPDTGAADPRNQRRQECGLTSEVGGVARGEVVPFFREIIEREDGRHRANRDAGAAIDALDGIDIKQFRRRVLGVVFLRMNAIHRARIHASGVFGVDARFSNYVGHKGCPTPESSSLCRLFYSCSASTTAHSSKNSARGTGFGSRRQK